MSDYSQIEELRRKYSRVFDSEDGQEVLEDLRNICFMYGTTLNEQPLIMAANEGQRTVVLHIETMLKQSKEIKENGTS